MKEAKSDGKLPEMHTMEKMKEKKSYSAKKFLPCFYLMLKCWLKYKQEEASEIA